MGDAFGEAVHEEVGVKVGGEDCEDCGDEERYFFAEVW